MRKKLLLADDSITIQKVVGIIFSSEEYELTIVDNGTAALAKARENIPDVLLVDAVMPGKTGYEVCEEIRRDPALQGIPILLMTGAFEPFDETKARQSGADDFISKPFESQHLIDKVLNLAELAGKRSVAVPSPAPAAAPFVNPPMTDTVRPVPPAPVPLSPPPAAASAVPIPGESTDFFALEEEAAPVAAPQPVPAAAPDFELEIVEGTSDDDLWGAFDLEDLAVDEGAETEAASFEVEQLAAGADEAEEPFVFVEDERGEAPPAAAAGPDGLAPQWLPVDEAEFSFEDEAGPVSPEVPPAGPFDLFEQEPPPQTDAGLGGAEDFFMEKGGGADQEFVIEASAPAAPEIAGGNEFIPPAETGFDFQFVPEEEYAPAAEAPAPPVAPPAAQAPGLRAAPAGEFMPAAEAVDAFIPPAPPAAYGIFDQQFAPEEAYVPAPAAPLAPAAPPSPAPAPPAVAAGVALSDEQLAGLVARISQELIEKIAWEVVPDLAERIIREEIRKIKEGA